MIKNYFKTTFRHLWRYRLFTGLNVLGLSIGITACWIIYRMIDYEYSFDKKQPDAGRIYQVVNRSEAEGEQSGFAGIAKALTPVVDKDIAGIELTVPLYFHNYEFVSITKENQEAKAFDSPDKEVRTLPAYFSMIPYQWLAGDPKKALDAPDKVVLTQSRASAYFPGLTPREILGRILLYDDSLAIAVSGIVADLDYPNSFEAQEFFALSKDDLSSTSWGSYNSNNLLFVKLQKQVKPDQVLKQINRINEQHNRDQFKKYNYKQWYAFLPLAEKHFAVEYGSQTRTADQKVLKGLAGIAAFLLLLACINYVNLSTAQMPQRAREIGIRKTLGSMPGQLIARFLGETMLVTIFSLVFSFLLSFAAFRLFADYIPERMPAFRLDVGFAGFAVVLVLLITVLSGLYPGWLITRLQTVRILKGETAGVLGNGHGFNLRKSLIIFQFVVAQVFVISAIIIGQQLRYTLQKDLGFNKNAVVTVDIPFNVFTKPAYEGKQFILKEALKNYPGIEAVALGDKPMSNQIMSNMLVFQSDTGEVMKEVNLKFADTDLTDLYAIKLLAGKKLSASDTMREYVINEAAVKAFGFSSPQAAVGQQLITAADRKSLPITGVVRDFHQFQFKTSIGPAALVAGNDELSTINIKLRAAQPGTWSKSIGQIKASWKKIYPGVPFEYKFYDETIASLYKQEQRMAQLIRLATGISILISCLGLFGLATLTAYQRTKEIGIRKVLGATVSGIVALLSKDFIKLVCLAMLIASPIAWWAMQQWLADYAYKISIQWWMFAMAGGLAVVIALLTVSYQALRTAMANPVDSLRDE